MHEPGVEAQGLDREPGYSLFLQRLSGRIGKMLNMARSWSFYALMCHLKENICVSQGPSGGTQE